MDIVLSPVEKGSDHVLKHDLNFQNNRYEAKHTIVSALYRMLYDYRKSLVANIILACKDIQEP